MNAARLIESVVSGLPVREAVRRLIEGDLIGPGSNWAGRGMDIGGSPVASTVKPLDPMAVRYEGPDSMPPDNALRRDMEWRGYMSNTEAAMDYYKARWEDVRRGSKFKIGDLVQINRTGQRKVFQVTRITSYMMGGPYSYTALATTGGPKGSQISDAKERDLVKAGTAKDLRDPDWTPKPGDTVIVSHLNFEVRDTVLAVRFERGRWNMYLKDTRPMPGRKAAVTWDGTEWWSGSYGSSFNSFSVEPDTGKELRKDYD